MPETTELTLYLRHGCHLCDDMLYALQQLNAELPPERVMMVTGVDIDEDEALVERYGTRVPVLELEGRFICEYFLDRQGLLEALGIEL